LCFILYFHFVAFEEVYIVERVFSSSLLAIVTKQEPRQINLYDVRIGEEIYANKFPTNILAIKMNLSVNIRKNRKIFHCFFVVRGSLSVWKKLSGFLINLV
jgi:hypothetical protein